MKNRPASFSARPAPPSFEISDLRQDVLAAIEMISQQILRVSDRLTALEEHLGVADQVSAKLRISDTSRAASRALEAKEALLRAVQAGKIVPVETVGPSTLVTGIELDSLGDPVPPGHVQSLFGSFNDETQRALLGKKAGDRIRVGPGLFEITGTYEEAGRLEQLC